MVSFECGAAIGIWLYEEEGRGEREEEEGYLSYDDASLGARY